MNFSEAIRLFEAGGSPTNNLELNLKITHLYYNRCLSFFHLNQHNNAISDANHILSKLDPENAKARLRRAHCYKALEKWAEALKDFQ
jgi:tetratricopeptide (TPR) repeat protein